MKISHTIKYNFLMILLFDYVEIQHKIKLCQFSVKSLCLFALMDNNGKHASIRLGTSGIDRHN